MAVHLFPLSGCSCTSSSLLESAIQLQSRRCSSLHQEAGGGGGEDGGKKERKPERGLDSIERKKERLVHGFRFAYQLERTQVHVSNELPVPPLAYIDC